MSQQESRIYFEIDFAASVAGQIRYIWRIRRYGNYEILAHSEVLNSHQACMDAINIVYQDAGKSKLVDKTKSR